MTGGFFAADERLDAGDLAWRRRSRPVWAADDASVNGTGLDPLGARVGGAAVKLLRDGRW